MRTGKSHSGDWLAAAVYVRAAALRDPVASAFSVLGCGVCAAIALFQYAVFTSFLATSVIAFDRIPGDVWITGRGVESFDFPTPIRDSEAARLTRFFPGSSSGRVLFGFAPWRGPDGRGGNVALVAADGLALEPRTLITDPRQHARLGLDADPFGEIGQVTLRLSGRTAPLSTFVGVPYVLSNFRDGADALASPAGMVSILTLSAATGDLRAAIAAARRAAPELEIYSRAEFRHRTQMFWLTRTGAGAAILLAAVLAGVLFVVFLLNGISRFSQRRRADLMSLLGSGASHGLIGRVLILNAALVAAAGAATGLIVTPLLDTATGSALPWVSLKAGDVGMLIAATAVAAGLAALLAIREARALPLTEVFRT